MGRADRPALRGTWLGNFLSLLNPLLKRLLRSPLHWPWSTLAVVIEFTGIRSGRKFVTPVNYVRDGDRLLLTTGDRWWRNLAGGAPVRVWVRGRQQPALAEAVQDDEEALALHERMIELRPIFGRLMGITRGDQREQLRRAIRAGRRPVIVKLEQTPTRRDST